MKHNHRDGSVKELDKTRYPRKIVRLSKSTGRVVDTIFHPAPGGLTATKRGAKRDLNRKERQYGEAEMYSQLDETL